jgi:hypothetical protein
LPQVCEFQQGFAYNQTGTGASKFGTCFFEVWDADFLNILPPNPAIQVWTALQTAVIGFACGRLHCGKEKHSVDGVTSAKGFTVLLCFKPFPNFVLENMPHVDGTLENCVLVYLLHSPVGNSLNNSCKKLVLLS